MTLTPSTRSLLTPQFEHFAASARGPLHAELDSRNQDAWKASRTSAGVVVAVADGMGSKPLADIGSRTACAAAVAATELWWRADDAPVSALPSLIESLWRTWLGPVAPDDARTTCLVAGVSQRGALVMAAIGDGLALICDDSEMQVLTAERMGFSNETHALGRMPTAGAWRVATRGEVPPGTAVLLATDGVADDLLPARRGDFARQVIGSYGDLPDWQRGFELWRALHDWPTPGHSDDKTVAVLWRSR